jgi:hypothetical protein
VSLSSSESLRVFVGPDHVAGVRVARGFGARRSAEPLRTLRVEPGEASGASMLAALDTLFEERGRAAKRVRVVLSNALVRYLVVPWSARITRAEERHALARHAIPSVFGAAATGWTFVVSPGGDDAHTLAAAVDTPLLEGLRAAAERGGATLASVQPLLMAVFNHWRRDVGRDAVSLLLLEPGRWCWASVAEGVWRRVQSGRMDDADESAVAEIVARQLSLNAAGEPLPLALPQVWVYADAGAAPVRLASPEWRLRELVLDAREALSGMQAGAEHALLAA